MAKITRHNGPSDVKNDPAPAAEAPETDAETVKPSTRRRGRHEAQEATE